MSRILITSPLPRDGKTTVAAGLAHTLRRTGATVRLVRAANPDQPGGSTPSQNTADADAATFARIPGVRATGRPEVLDPALPNPDTDHTIVEVPAPAHCDALRRSDERGDTRVLLVTRHRQADDAALQRAALAATGGGQTGSAANPHGLLVNACPTDPLALSGNVDTDPSRPTGAAIAEAQRLADLLNLPLLATVPQDRLLSAPLVEAMARAVDGELGGDQRLWSEAAEWLQVGPISAHSGIDAFSRYPDKSVITRKDKLDVALAALDSAPLCLILSGGPPNLPYIAERAEQEAFALIITPLDTPQAVNRIGALYGDTPFAGQRKLQRAAALIAACDDLLPALTPAPA